MLERTSVADEVSPRERGGFFPWGGPIRRLGRDFARIVDKIHPSRIFRLGFSFLPTSEENDTNVSDALIKPQTLKGFRDFLPAAALAREQLIDTARGVYRRFGFAPIDTPALEYTEILLGKGGDETDKQMFRFEDQGGRDVAMRFDLTIPFARYAAQHASNLGLPFKRYHVGTVWRGDLSGSRFA